MCISLSVVVHLFILSLNTISMYTMHILNVSYLWMSSYCLSFCCVCVYMKCMYTYPSAWAGCDTGSIFKWCLTGLNSEFSFWTSCHTKVEELRLPYYSPIAEGRLIGFIPFPRVLALCEMQTVSPRIWTWVIMSISYNSIHYAMNASSVNISQIY